MKLSEIVLNMLAVIMEIKKKLKIVLAGVFGVALQEHTPFIRLRRNFQSCCKHAHDGFGNLIYK